VATVLPLAVELPALFNRLGWRGVSLYVGVVVLVVAGFGLIVWIGRALRAEDAGPAPDHNLLAHFRELHEQRVLSDEEYHRIKAKLREKIRRQLDSPRDPPPEPPAPDDRPPRRRGGRPA